MLKLLEREVSWPVLHKEETIKGILTEVIIQSSQP